MDLTSLVNSGLINTGLGYGTLPATKIPVKIYTPKQQVTLVNLHEKIHTQMAMSAKNAQTQMVKASRGNKVSGYYGDQYYMPNDAVGVM